MADAHANFAVSTVATAPSPADSGTSLVVASGHGTRFPAVSFNATVWPAGEQPTPANAEVVRVSVIATDTFTIARAQESSSARTIVVGDNIAATVTAKTLTDAEAGPAAVAGEFYVVGSAVTVGSLGAINKAWFQPIVVQRTIAVSSFQFGVETANGNMDVGIYSQDLATRRWSWGSFAVPSSGWITKLISGGTPTSLSLTGPGVYWLAIVADGTTATFVSEGTTTWAADAPGILSKSRASSLPLPADASTAAVDVTKGLVCLGIQT